GLIQFGEIEGSSPITGSGLRSIKCSILPWEHKMEAKRFRVSIRVWRKGFCEEQSCGICGAAICRSIRAIGSCPSSDRGAGIWQSDDRSAAAPPPPGDGQAPPHGYDRRAEHCEYLRHREHELREQVAYAPYGPERARLEHQLRETHYARDRCWR